MARSSSEDSYSPRPRSRSNRKYYRDSSASPPKRDSYRPYGKPRLGKQNLSCVFVVKKAESDLKFHIKFEHLKIQKKNQHEMAQIFKEKLSEHVGPVENVSLIPENENEICICLGFKYDADALKYYQGNEGQIQIKCGRDTITLVPRATDAFRYLIPHIKRNPNDKKPMVPRKPARVCSSSSSDDLPHYNRDKDHYAGRHGFDTNKDRNYSNNRRNSRQPKKNYIFGLPTHFRSKDLVRILGNQFYVKEVKTRKIEQSNCEAFQVDIDEKKIDKLLSKNEIEGYPVIMVREEFNQESIKNALKVYQIKLQFPEKISPYYVYKHLSKCAKLIQIISGQRLENEQSSSYLVTFNNTQCVKQLIKVGKTNYGVQAMEAQGHLVYRPTKTSEFFAQTKKDDNTNETK